METIYAAIRDIYARTNVFFKLYGRRIIVLFVILYIAAFCYISYLKYASFSYGDIDLSVIEQAFWNAIHGKFIAEEIGERVISRGHLFLIIFLLAPFYALYPHPLTLLFMQTAALALPAYFIYYFARKKLDSAFAFYFALAYLLYPALAYVNLFEFHLIAFAPLFLIPMFIFYDARKFWLFILFMFLSLSCKEDVSLVIFGLGVYGIFRYVRLKPPFIQRADWKWIAVPLLSGVLWFILVTQFIQPYFNVPELKGVSDSRGVLAFYGWLGGTPGEIIRNIFLHPLQVLRGVFTPAKNTYLLHLFGPLAFLSVFGIAQMSIVLFGLLESLLSQRPTHFSIYYQYPALVMPFIFISAIFGLKRLFRFVFFKRIKLYILLTLFAVSIFSAFKIGPLFRLPFNSWRKDARDALKEEFIRLVPQDAAVAASFELATRLTHRDNLFFVYHINIADRSPQYSYLSKKYGEKADYLLVDFEDYLTYFGFYSPRSDIYVKKFLEKYGWGVIYDVNNISLWGKENTNIERLVETIDNFPVRLSGSPFSNEYIKFAGYQLKNRTVLGRPVLRFDGYLECLRPTTRRYVLEFDLYGKRDKRIIYRHYFIAADRIYPTKRWKKGEKIKISQNILLPDSLEIKDCAIELSLVIP